MFWTDGRLQLAVIVVPIVFVVVMAFVIGVVIGAVLF
jgi:hypothetical protein